MSSISELIDYKYMIRNLVKRDVRGRYKGSALGFLWNFVLPLVQILVFTIVFGAIFHNQIQNYPIYLISGMVFWIWFSESITDSSGVFVRNSQMIKKIYFPRMVLPIVSVTAKMVNFLILLGFLFIIMLILGHNFTINLLFLPLIIIISYVFIFGLSLILSALDVFFRDVQYIVSALLMALIWMTPIMYMPSNLNNELINVIVKYNPLTYFVNVFHDIIYNGVAPSLMSWAMCIIITAVSLICGYFVFRHLESDFAEVL